MNVSGSNSAHDAVRLFADKLGHYEKDKTSEQPVLKLIGENGQTQTLTVVNYSELSFIDKMHFKFGSGNFNLNSVMQHVAQQDTYSKALEGTKEYEDLSKKKISSLTQKDADFLVKLTSNQPNSPLTLTKAVLSDPSLREFGNKLVQADQQVNQFEWLHTAGHNNSDLRTLLNSCPPAEREKFLTHVKNVLNDQGLGSLGNQVLRRFSSTSNKDFGTTQAYEAAIEKLCTQLIAIKARE